MSELAPIPTFSLLDRRPDRTSARRDSVTRTSRSDSPVDGGPAWRMGEASHEPATSPRDRGPVDPAPEPLEGRRVPAQFGVPWHDADHLTLSFVPDGTPVGGRPATCSGRSTPERRRPTGSARSSGRSRPGRSQADINFAAGAPTAASRSATPGPDQHDPRFGDIRIGAVPMAPGRPRRSRCRTTRSSRAPGRATSCSTDTVAFDGGGADLFPVMLHEVGPRPGARRQRRPRVGHGRAPGQRPVAPRPGDIAAIQALYGPRTADPFEGPSGNDTLATAAAVPDPAGFDGTTPLFLYADVSSPGDADVFSLRGAGRLPGPDDGPAPDGGGQPARAPPDRLRRGRARSSPTSPRPATPATRSGFTLPAVEPGATYYVQARAATGGPLRHGRVRAGRQLRRRGRPSARRDRHGWRGSPTATCPPRTSTRSSATRRTPSSTTTTTPTTRSRPPRRSTRPALYGSRPRSGSRPAWATRPTSTSTASRRRKPRPGPTVGRPLVMTVTVRATEVNGIMPRVDGLRRGAESRARRRARPRRRDLHGPGRRRPPGDRTTSSGSPPTRPRARSSGNYELDVEYGHDAARPADVRRLDARRRRRGDRPTPSWWTRPSSSTSCWPPSGGAGPDRLVSMTITDASGRVVASRTARSGETAGGDPVLLAPGSYQAEFSAASPRAWRPSPRWPSGSTGRASPTRSARRWTTPTRRRLAAPTVAGLDPLPLAIGSVRQPLSVAGTFLDLPTRPVRNLRRRIVLTPGPRYWWGADGARSPCFARTGGWATGGLWARPHGRRGHRSRGRLWREGRRRGAEEPVWPCFDAAHARLHDGRPLRAPGQEPIRSRERRGIWLLGGEWDRRPDFAAAKRRCPILPVWNGDRRARSGASGHRDDRRRPIPAQGRP